MEGYLWRGPCPAGWPSSSSPRCDPGVDRSGSPSEHCDGGRGREEESVNNGGRIRDAQETYNSNVLEIQKSRLYIVELYSSVYVLTTTANVQQPKLMT